MVDVTGHARRGRGLSETERDRLADLERRRPKSLGSPDFGALQGLARRGNPDEARRAERVLDRIRASR